MRPIEVVLPIIRRLHIKAVVLWPFIVYGSQEIRRDECTQAHELFHWRQALRMGVIPFYLLYLVLGIFYIGRPASEHPLEREGYRIQRACEEERASI